jgi:hypothetical protein
MRVTGSNWLRLLLALTVLVSVMIRPPGTMLALEGDKITYVLCTGAGMETVEVALDGGEPREIDLGCDFFAAQIAALPVMAPAAVGALAKPVRLAPVPAPLLMAAHDVWSPYTSRAPPFVS